VCSSDLQILTANGLPAPVDRSGDGQSYGPSSLVGVTAQDVRPISRATTPWVDYVGTWGENQYFHAPAPIGTVVLGTSPQSPALTRLWKRPLRVIEEWPVG